MPQSKCTELCSLAAVVPQSKSTKLCSLAAVVPQSKSTEMWSSGAPFHHDLWYFRHRTNEHFSSMLLIRKNVSSPKRCHSSHWNQYTRKKMWSDLGRSLKSSQVKKTCQLVTVSFHSKFQYCLHVGFPVNRINDYIEIWIPMWKLHFVNKLMIGCSWK